ncbi:MAG TPA: pyridoxal 5'-phosphate synthase, partial [Mucilaginibacter sp.]|nr:pyridoxal 5'-phosphate synthase [Mucilaginibacter sp.]
MDQHEIQNIRNEYHTAKLSEKDADADPVKQFEKWFNEALSSQQHEPTAMTLATATPDGRPSARIVLMKGFSSEGFSFYTNYLSRKGKEIAKNPLGALTFFWDALERQVRIEGTIEKLDRETSEQ